MPQLFRDTDYKMSYQPNFLPGNYVFSYLTETGRKSSRQVDPKTFYTAVEGFGLISKNYMEHLIEEALIAEELGD